MQSYTAVFNHRDMYSLQFKLHSSGNAMIRSISIALVCFSLLQAVEAVAQDDSWVPITGAEKLSHFMSGLTAERALPGGEISRGEYHADGTGTLTSWGVSFARSWEIKGADQVCLSANSEPVCYHFERNTEDAQLYRARSVITGDWTEFRVSDQTAIVSSPPEGVGNKAGAANASAAEIAAELSNPNTALGTLNTNFDFIGYDGELAGADDQSAMKIVFQPSLPYPLGGGTNFFFRPAIPVIVKQPVPVADGKFDSAGVELGDIGFDASFGFSFKSNVGSNVLLAGTAGLIPTATDDSVGIDQWLFGPELGGFIVRKWGAFGIIGSHQWDVAGEDSFGTSITAGQYIYSINLKDGWQITGSPFWSYNHEAQSDDAWTFSVGGGLAKTAIIGGRPWKMSAQYLNYIERTDAFAPRHQIRFTIGPVVKLPWEGRG